MRVHRTEKMTWHLSMHARPSPSPAGSPSISGTSLVPAITSARSTYKGPAQHGRHGEIQISRCGRDSIRVRDACAARRPTVELFVFGFEFGAFLFELRLDLVPLLLQLLQRHYAPLYVRL